MSNVNVDLEDIVIKKLQEKNVSYKKEWVEESLGKFLLKTSPDKAEAVEMLESLDAEIVILKLNNDKRSESTKQMLRDRLVNAIASRVAEEVEEISRIESVISNLEKPIKANTNSEDVSNQKEKYKKPVILSVEKAVDPCKVESPVIKNSAVEETDIVEDIKTSEEDYWRGKLADEPKKEDVVKEKIAEDPTSLLSDESNTSRGIDSKDECEELSKPEEKESSESKEDNKEYNAATSDKPNDLSKLDKSEKSGIFSRFRSSKNKKEKSETVKETQEGTKKLEDSSESFLKGKSKALISLVVCIALGLVVGLIISKCVVSAAYVHGNSMYPTYEDGQMLFINRLAEPTRGSVVVVKDSNEGEEDHLLIKRVIGLPGEMLEITDGSVYINGQKLVEGYLQEGVETHPADYGTYENLGADSYFVMGDNRDESKDSRYIGPVNKEDIVGVVID